MESYSLWRLRIQDFFETRVMHWIVGMLTIANTLALGIETIPTVHQGAEHLLEYLHIVILWAFVIEILLRVIAYGPNYFKRAWNIFDFLIVVGSFLPLSKGVSALRSLRVLHLFAVIEDMPKTRHIITGLYRALPGIANVVFLMLFLFFIYSVFGVYFFQNKDVPGFPHLGIAMKTMFQVLTGDDWSRVLMETEKVYPYAWIYFYTYYISMVFVILNLFIGVVVGAMQAAEAEVYEQDNDETNEKLDKIYRELASLKREIKRLES